MTSSKGDTNDSRPVLLGKVGELFKILVEPCPANIVDLWKEHVKVRGELEEVSKIQTALNSNSCLLRERNAKDLDFFLAWAKQVGIDHSSVDIEYCRDVQGYGLVAKKELAKGEVVLSVPRTAMMSLTMAKKSSMFKKAFERDSLLQSMDNVGLALFLAANRIGTTRWSAYLNMLPTSFTTPLFYTEEQFLQLKPSPIFEESLRFYRTVARQFCYFFLLVGKNDLYNKMCLAKRTNGELPPALHNAPFTIENFTFALYKWAVGCVSTRINMIPGDSTDDKGNPIMVPALIPVLDLANHEFVKDLKEDEIALSYSTETDTAQIEASRSFSVDSAVTVFYGQRSNADHLLHNGFVPEGENAADRFKLKIGVPKTDKHLEARQRLIELLGLTGWNKSNVFLFDIKNGPDPLPTVLITFATVYVANPPTKKNVDDPSTLSKAVEFLKTRFSLLERAYASADECTTSIGKDIDRLKQSEVAILANARKFCEDWEKKLERN